MIIPGARLLIATIVVFPRVTEPSTTLSVTTVPTTHPTTSEQQLTCYSCNSAEYSGCGQCFDQTGLTTDRCHGRCLKKTTFVFKGTYLALTNVTRSCSTDSSVWINTCRNEGDIRVCYVDCKGERCNDGKGPQPGSTNARVEPSAAQRASAASCYECTTREFDGCGGCFDAGSLSQTSCITGVCQTKGIYENRPGGYGYVLKTVERSCGTTLSGDYCTADGQLTACYGNCNGTRALCNKEKPPAPKLPSDGVSLKCYYILCYLLSSASVGYTLISLGLTTLR